MRKNSQQLNLPEKLRSIREMGHLFRLPATAESCENR
jgi:hypothetical protein